MAIIPLQLARVSNSLQMSVMRQSLTRTQRSLLQTQNELATGKRLNAPSDDPADAAISIQLRKLMEQREGYATNLQAAVSHLSEVDSTLGEMTDLLREAQTVASANVGSVVSSEARVAAATAIEGIFNQVFNLGNRQFQGVYLFGGDRSTQAPFVADLGGVRYVGSETTLGNAVEANIVLPFMVNGGELFGAMSTRVQGSADLTPSISVDTRLADVRGHGEEGIRPGSIRLSNGANTVLVDLSEADTIGDVVDSINAAGVGGITTVIAPDGQSLLLSAGPADNITVEEAGGTTAADLGILTTTGGGAGVSVDGQSVRPKVTGFTPLADLLGGLGIDTAGGLQITNGVKTATIDLSGCTTVEDMLNAINGAGAGVLGRINAAGDGIDIMNTVQGITMTIAENGGTTAADLGVRSFGPQTLLADVNGGKGVRTATGMDLLITRRDGTSFQVEIDGLTTIQDVIDAINTADGGAGVTASFATTGNGIVLADGTGGAGVLSVSGVSYSQAAADLGLEGGVAGTTLAGRDVNGVAAQGLLANLAKLRDALTGDDPSAITEASEALTADLARVIRVRGQVGARVQEFESRLNRLEDQKLASQAVLSALEDADYNEAITRFQTLQTALQANMMTAGQMLNLTLLDFLR